MTPPRKRRCKDCPPGLRRDAKFQGPRCASCWRAYQAAKSAERKAKYVLDTYGITECEYQAIYEAQGGFCYICRRAKGTGRRRLAVDHDHSCCPGPVIECGGTCVRGLLCRKCNRDILGHLRDDVNAFQRAIEYLINPPAKLVIATLRGTA